MQYGFFCTGGGIASAPAFGGVGGMAAFGGVRGIADLTSATAFAFDSTVLICGLLLGPLLLEAPPVSGTSTSILSLGAIAWINSIIVLAFALAGSGV